MQIKAVTVQVGRVCRKASLAAATLLAAEALSGCIVAGYSSRGGFFVWPGSVVITLVLLLVFFLFRRGR